MKMQPSKYSIEKKAAISLSTFQIVDVKFEINQQNWGNQELSNDCNLSIKFSALTEKNEVNVFGILFNVFLVNESKTFSLEIDAFAKFIVEDVQMNEEFLNSTLVTGNAPAIVFPYLRAYITSFCQNSGFNPIILPGFNFTHVSKIE